MLRRFGLVAIVCLWVSTAHAVLINSSVGTYDVTTVTGAPLTTLDDQVWWQDGILAGEFLLAVRDSLGLFSQPNYPFEPAGPLFAFNEYQARQCSGGTGCPNTFLVSLNTIYDWDSYQQLTFPAVFAVARRVEDVPAPATLALLGLGLAGVWRLQHRETKAT